MKFPGRGIRTIIIGLAILSVLWHGVTMSAHDRDLVRPLTSVVDIVSGSGQSVLMFTRSFAVYEADPVADAWTEIKPTLNVDKSEYDIGRIGGALRVGNVVIVSGHIVSRVTPKPHSALLRSTDNGRSFSVVEITADTMGTTDKIGQTIEGRLFFVDRVGRLWLSDDVGMSWRSVNFPKTIPLGTVREVDLINNNMGACIDNGRDFHFTTNGWSSSISPLESKREIRESQPSMLDYFVWDRSMYFWDNALIMVEGDHTYRSASNDLLWEPWHGVIEFAMADDRSSIAYWTNDGKLWSSKSLSAAPTLIASDVVRPDVLRIIGNRIVVYRPDTGPIFYEGGVVSRARPYHATKRISSPGEFIFDEKGDESGWGLLTAIKSAVIVDIVRQGADGEWHRDTVLPIGPIRTMRALNKDEIILGDLRRTYRYSAKTKLLSRYKVEQPLANFLKKPVARFKVRVAADELDSTHVQWAEYRLHGDNFVCTEMVDSSRFGVSSELISITIPRSEIVNILNKVNRRGDAGFDLSTISVTDDVKKRYKALVDTLFVHDAYFDVFDLYRPPPTPEVQIVDCKERFMAVTDTIGSLSKDVIENAILSFRRVPKDEFSRYEIEIENTAGRVLVFRVDHEDEAHPPLMTPWIGSGEGLRWHIYDADITDLFLRAISKKATPPLFTEMAKKEWLLVAVASYLDRIQRGRYHRWANREVVPGAR